MHNITRHLISALALTMAAFSLLLPAPGLAATAGLRIYCDRPATIYLNGKESGQCPKNLTPEAGSYTVVLKAPVAENTLYYYQQTVVLGSGVIEKVDATLKLTIDCRGEVKSREARIEAYQRQEKQLNLEYEQCVNDPKRDPSTLCPKMMMKEGSGGIGHEDTEEIAKLKCDCFNKSNVLDGHCEVYRDGDRPGKWVWFIVGK
jgi:hypothetical protein